MGEKTQKSTPLTSVSHHPGGKKRWQDKRRTLVRFCKYSISSLVTSGVEWGLFLLLTDVLGEALIGFFLTAVPVVIARGIAYLLNFYINQKLVFRIPVATGRALGRYLVLAIPMTVAQVGLTYGLYSLLQIGAEQVLLRGLLYGAVMTTLFGVSYLLQKQWVFRYQKNARE